MRAFYSDRAAAEQHIKEGKYALKWTRLPCMRFAANAVLKRYWHALQARCRPKGALHGRIVA